jgi:hypothetical protein
MSGCGSPASNPTRFASITWCSSQFCDGFAEAGVSRQLSRCKILCANVNPSAAATAGDQNRLGLHSSSVCKIPWSSPVSGGRGVHGERTAEGAILSCLAWTRATRSENWMDLKQQQGLHHGTYKTISADKACTGGNGRGPTPRGSTA